MSTHVTGEHKSVYRHMVRGSTWAIALTWAMRGIGIVNTAILARLLSPDDFGLVAMATLAFGLLDTFANFGTSTLIFRERDPTRAHCDTAWTIGALRGLVLGVALAASAPLIARYFGEPRVIPVVYVVAVNAALNGAVSVGLILMRKELDFAGEFRYLVSVRILTFVATIGLALWLRSYWALVLGSTAGGLFALWRSFAVHPYRPRPSLALAREYLAFTYKIIPLNICFYLASRADSFVVGRLSPAPVLGLYNVASDVSGMFTTELTMQIGRALFPAYSTLSHDLVRLREAFLNSFAALVIVNVAFGLGLFAVSDEFVPLVLGAKWSGAVPFIAWLAIAGMLRGLLQPTQAILWICRRDTAASVLMFVRFAVISAAAIAGGLLGGAHAVAVAVTLALAALLPIGVSVLRPALGVGMKDLLRTAWRPAIAGTLMVLAVDGVRATVVAGKVPLLAAEVAVGAVVFITSLLVLWVLARRPAGPEAMVLEVVRARWERWRRPPSA